MRLLVKVFDGRRAMALAFAGAAAALLAGCSSDVSPFSNPFQDSARFGGSDATATGTILPPAPIGQADEVAQAGPVGQGGPVAPLASEPASAPIAETPLAPVRPVASGSWNSASLAAPAYMGPPAGNPPDVSHGGGVVKVAHGVWAADGGTPIVIRSGENAATLAERYDVPVDVLIHVNGFISAAQMRPGMRIVIPVYSASNGAPRPAHVAEVDRPADHAPERTAARRREDEARGRTTYRFVRGPSGAPVEAREKTASNEHARSGRDAQASEDKRDAEDGAAQRRREQTAQKADGRPDELKSAQARERATDAESASLAPPARKSSVDKTATGSLPPEQAEAVVARPDFRWPAHGRIIEGFKPGANDGINIAVPDGTAVRAVDDGVVAYAGDELKGYGNLVLIRHPNGFVSAYADNGELDVKRGEIVKRGQIIAKSGQSGNVDSPQLHFELRKGQTPVDPTLYLAGL